MLASLSNDYQHCSAKRRQMRTGERLSDATLRVIKDSPSPVQNSAPASSPPPTPLQVNYRRNHSHTQPDGERERGQEGKQQAVQHTFFQKPTNQVRSSGSFSLPLMEPCEIIVAVFTFGAFHVCCCPRALEAPVSARGFFFARIRG